MSLQNPVLPLCTSSVNMFADIIVLLHGKEYVIRDL